MQKIDAPLDLKELEENMSSLNAGYSLPCLGSIWMRQTAKCRTDNAYRLSK
jgi:hypothetical protein